VSLKWRCVKSGHWRAEADGVQWHVWAVVNPAGWMLDGWETGDDLIHSSERPTLAEAKRAAAAVMAERAAS